jgi:DnaJ-class molecular chaperone
MTHYDTLGVTADADTSAVREAYKRRALETHPDRAAGDSRAFLELSRAYDCLRDAASRKAYDASLASRRARPLADVIDVEEMTIETISYGDVFGVAGVNGDALNAGLGGVDAYRRECRCGDAYEIPVGELQLLRRTHDECVLECGGCSLRIGVRLSPLGVGEDASVLSA